MILIVGKYQSLADRVAEKFKAMGYGDDVLVRNSNRLVDFLAYNDTEIELLVFVDKRRKAEEESSSRMDQLQWLWTFATKHAVPLILLFFKYNSDNTLDAHLDRFATWTGKQYRQPPFHYLFKLGELYGLDDGESLVDDFCRQILRDKSISLVRKVGMDGNRVERETDYVYVLDVTRVLYWFVVHRPESGVYELGSGFSRTDSTVANVVFRTLNLPPQIEYVEKGIGQSRSVLPVLAVSLSHLRRVGYRKPFCSVEKGVKSYIQKSILRG